ncbi:unnamed protein product [Rotaria sp. Silwood2]|nr:unnamed protein product [Rotaria sp. Silwood2]
MSFKQFESIFYPAFDSYGLAEWTLEKMPKGIIIERNATRSTNRNGWFFKSHNGRSKFYCPKCSRQNKANGKPIWSSVYTRMLFGAQYSEENDKDGVIWGSGRVQMKIFEQGCQTCGTYSTGHFDEYGISFALYWLHIWILKTFYNVKIHDDDDHDRPQSEELSRGPHNIDLCNACRSGWCKYQQQEKRHSNVIKGKKN